MHFICLYNKCTSKTCKILLSCASNDRIIIFSVKKDFEIQNLFSAMHLQEITSYIIYTYVTIAVFLVLLFIRTDETSISISFKLKIYPWMPVDY